MKKKVFCGLNEGDELLRENTGLSKTFVPLQPIIKWPGGKETELPYIREYLPEKYNNFYEPFVGGGSVFMWMEANRYFVNDKSKELASLYNSISAQNDRFFSIVENISQSWKNELSFAKRNEKYLKLYLKFREGDVSRDSLVSTISGYLEKDKGKLLSCLSGFFSWHRDIFEKELFVNLCRKLQRMKKLESEKGNMPSGDVYDNIETAFMSALYMYFRALYNDKSLTSADEDLGTALFVFIRNYAYSGMFRYNDKGDFNVPYGGIAYNRKLMDKKQVYYRSQPVQERFARTTVYNCDFEEFFSKASPRKDDFIFLDPPYDSEFSTYARNVFGREDQERLADYLINRCKAQWMMIIKNTPFIKSLYENKGLNIQAFGKKYLVSFMNRNEKDVEHLIIMNYGK